MAITYPRAMPSAGIISSPLRSERVDFLSPEQGGRLLGVTAGFPLWRLMVNLTTMDLSEADEWEAWLLTMRGVQRQFYGTDPLRSVPRFYRRGRPYAEAATSWSQSIDGDGNAVLHLEGIDPGQVISVNDLIGFRWSTKRRSLVRAMETVAANASGTVNVIVEPPVPTVTPSNAVAHFRDAACVMRLVTGETELGQAGIDGFTSAGGRIVGIEDLRP